MKEILKQKYLDHIYQPLYLVLFSMKQNVYEITNSLTSYLKKKNKTEEKKNR